MPPKKKRQGAEKRRLREEFVSLHQEMELATYATTESGQARRKLSRKESLVRSRKRKALEKQDRQDLAVEHVVEGRRLRGSRAAEEDNVIQGSLVFGAKADSDDEAGASEGEEDEALGEEDDQVMDSEDDDYSTKARKSAAKETKSTPKKSAGSAPASVRRPRKKRLVGMKTFRSKRLADRHGEAIEALSRGLHREAIAKLKEVAHEAPSAPQVYLSLGLVYEDMLRRCRTRGAQESEMPLVAVQGSVQSNSQEERVPDPSLREQLDLAKKSYGSFHVAALLCKRDYTLWTRAADMAREISSIHTSIMQLDGLSEHVFEYNRTEKHRWLFEAKNDYQTADNLDPPGIDVPAKLAEVMIELGYFAEALTLLTGLKNRKPVEDGKQSKFESSHSAWWLYADLMLRIGYECMQWNQHVETNGNSKFRRWLRKLSTSFDWKERRLQALVKALEAAAGSLACAELLEWLRSRALDGPVDTAKSPNHVETNSDQAPQRQQTLQREKDLLIRTNETELIAFDKTTEDLLLQPNEKPSKQREKARLELLERQKSKMGELVEEFEATNSGFIGEDPDQGEASASEATSTSMAPIRFAASVGTVYSISCELVRHMLDMNLFEGGLLVGQAVSLYLKERADLVLKRIAIRRQRDDFSRQTPFLFSVRADPYDMVDDSSDSGDDGFVSDEEVLSYPRHEALVMSMKAGALRSDLRVLVGLAMLGTRERLDEAFECIRAVVELLQESLAEINRSLVDTEAIKDGLWLRYKWTNTGVLSRHTGFLMIAATIHAFKREPELGHRLFPLFQKQVATMESFGIVEEVFSRLSSLTVDQNIADAQIVDIVLAFSRYQLHVANKKNDAMELVSLARRSVDVQLRALKALWRVQLDGSLSPRCITLAKSISRAFELLIQKAQSTEELAEDYERLKEPVEIMCGVVNLESQSSENVERERLVEMPLRAEWLGGLRQQIALRALNLAVGMNVGRFSGWNEAEFRLNLLQKPSMATSVYFGITLEDGLVAGLLTPFEQQLASLWEYIQTELSLFQQFDFHKALNEVRASSSYEGMKVKLSKANRDGPVSIFGEAAGISLLLAFASMCLRQAKAGGEPKVVDNLILSALSVLIPLSQFCLNRKLWDTALGQNSGSQVAAETYRKAFVEEKKDDTAPPSKRPGYVRPSRRLAAAPTHVNEASGIHWVEGEDYKSPWSNLIVLPCSVLLQTWKSGAEEDADSDSGDARALMCEVNEGMRMLCSCFTEPAVERASLSMAVSLIKLIRCSQCENPFLCFQQAVRFASQAAKLGTNDLPFKIPLPETGDCSPREALAILCRAECLQALHFCAEAAFLCRFVLSLCRQRRSNLDSNLKWIDRWALVAIQAYNTSVAIRHKTGGTPTPGDKKGELSPLWEPDLIGELKRARKDGRLLRQQLSVADVSAISELQGNGCGVISVAPTSVDDDDEDNSIIFV